MRARACLRALLLAACCSVWACAPVPVGIYVPDPAQGKPLFASCPLNKHIPDGIEVELDGIVAQVSLEHAFERGFLDVRLDVPSSRTVLLQSDRVALDRHDGRPSVDAHYLNISHNQSQALYSANAPPELVRDVMPVQSPMIGGEIAALGQPRHYWMAAWVDTAGAEVITVTLPGMAIDGVPARFPDLRFRRQLFVAMALLNC